MARGVVRGMARVHDRGDRHEALHEVLDCLGEMLWRAQRSKLPPDGEAYIDCVRRKAG